MKRVEVLTKNLIYANNGIRYLKEGGDKNMTAKQVVAWVLVIGAVNWGLVGLMNLNVVEMILGAGSLLTKIVYIIVGLAGVYKAYMLVAGPKK